MPGRPKDPAYWRKWRATHPEYRRREALRRKARKAAMTAEERRRDRGPYRPVPPPEPMPVLHLGHPVLEQARVLVQAQGGHEDRRVMVYDPTYDDLVMEAALALLEGRPADEAIRHAWAQEQHWKVLHITGCDGSWNRLNE